jgi:hypothetical protein
MPAKTAPAEPETIGVKELPEHIRTDARALSRQARSRAVSFSGVPRLVRGTCAVTRVLAAQASRSI